MQYCKKCHYGSTQVVILGVNNVILSYIHRIKLPDRNSGTKEDILDAHMHKKGSLYLASILGSYR